MDNTQFSDFLTLVANVWNHGVYGVNIGELLTALAIMLAFVILRRLFAIIVTNRLRRLARRTKTTADDEVIDALERPLQFIPIVMGVFFASQYLAPEGPLHIFFMDLSRSLIAFNIFWALYRVVAPASLALRGMRDFLTESMVAWTTKAVKAAFIFLGATAILEIWGIEVGPIIAGLGLFGVAVALGAQDLFKNLIAGLFVIGEGRFNVGDWVKVEGIVEGTVEDVGFRTTRIRRFDKAPVYVPNSELSDNAITNFSQMTHRRIKWLITLEYRTSVAQLRAIRDRIEAYILADDAFAKPDEVATFVRIDSFNDSSIDMLLYCFTRTTDWGEWLAVKETLACVIKDIVEGNGAGFAFPSRSVYLENAPGTGGPEISADNAERFPAPESGEEPGEEPGDRS